MKKEEVPQQPPMEFDISPLGFYVTNDQGGYDVVPCPGWEVGNDSLGDTFYTLAETAAGVRKRVEVGELSTLVYHMEVRQFPPKLLAQYLGMWTFQVKRHLKPRVFDQLPREVLERYASFFNITVEELRSLPDPNAPFRFFHGTKFKY
jgi:hypothetical protein